MAGKKDLNDVPVRNKSLINNGNYKWVALVQSVFSLHEKVCLKKLSSKINQMIAFTEH